jgi:hypothetical protein
MGNVKNITIKGFKLGDLSYYGLQNLKDTIIRDIRKIKIDITLKTDMDAYDYSERIRSIKKGTHIINIIDKLSKTAKKEGTTQKEVIKQKRSIEELSLSEIINNL